ncbi:Multidrug resistance protein ABC transporter family [Zostera marina]|uniref:Multidrug resistance protein ABC transporter family n=1 Tax=Zostera marina TaxID=29655 RepID=A0A0K9NNE3_ZOSMR|nr:Multidrug resistance protein ABC transporter family [Zostera marina]
MVLMEIVGPCLIEDLTSVILIVFFTFLSVRFYVLKLKKGDGGADDDNHGNDRNVSLGYSYTASIWICLFILWARLFRLFLTCKESSTERHRRSCNFKISFFSDQVLQILSWSLTFYMLYRLRNKSERKLPWVLRSWWIFNFLDSMIHVGFEIYRRSSPSTVEQYFDYSNLIPCIYMFWFSIRGTTGVTITFIGSSDSSEPFLPKQYKTQSDPDSSSPSASKCLYGEASLLQLITFSWLNPLFSVGYKKPLVLNQIPELHAGESAEFLSRSFGEIMSRTKQEGSLGSSLMYRSIFLFIRKKIIINTIFALVSTGAGYVGPILINDLVSFLNDGTSRLRNGYSLVGIFLATKAVEAICERQYLFGAQQLSARVCSAFISHTYRKGLVISNRSRQTRTNGEMINYMTVDAVKITHFMWTIIDALMLPIDIALATFVIYLNLGLVGAVATLTAIAAVMACNFPLIKLQEKLQSKIMVSKDDRMKSTSEVLKNMKILKLQAWDTEYIKRLVALRKIEHKWLSKSLWLNAIITFIFYGTPPFISAVAFGSCIWMGIPITVGKVLSSLATFNIIQQPIFELPDILSSFIQAKVSVGRLATYFDEPDIPNDAVEHVPREETDSDVEIVNGEFSWNSGEDTDRSYPGNPTLFGIQLTIKRGMKVAICGSVGAGKTSLLSCILGEIPKLKGKVRSSGSKAYVPQSAWILTGTVRDNILFGLPYDAEKYRRTVDACALAKDLSVFGNGDLTEIGEGGINMSGGQKQRIQIARAIYQNADIYLLDDPFSAVDAHTGTHIFQECLMKLHDGKTILYITHQIEFLPAADLILVMENGRIAQAGRFEELHQRNNRFDLLVGAHIEALRSVENSNSSRIKPIQSFPMETEEEIKPEIAGNTELLPLFSSGEEIGIEKGRLIQEEECEKGIIGKDVYLAYLRSVKVGLPILFILIFQILYQVLDVLSNYWIAWATPSTIDAPARIEMNVLFLVYLILTTGSSFFILVRSILVAITGLLASEKLFKDITHSVFHAPMSFFDSTPTSRIINRMSSDQSTVDLDLAQTLSGVVFSTIGIVGTITVMCQILSPVFFIIIPVVIISIWYQRYYIATARELSRIISIQRSPIIHHFSESLSGTATIRAFEQEHRFAETNLGIIDDFIRPMFHGMSTMEWLCFRLNVLSNLVFGFTLILLVGLPKGSINSSVAGLAVTYGLSLNSEISSIIFSACIADKLMISVERILQYTKLESEGPLVVKGTTRPSENWPENGTVCFKNLEIRYAPHLPSVLKNISCVFPGKKKIGVVGRTGSGKSTLIQSLFRIIEPRQGSIQIDNVDISEIGVHDLRSRIGIIPQDPTMFQGTVRDNLDPLHQYSDHDIWEVLNKCQIGDLVGANEEKLDSKVTENGDNWSVGQRQLLCLGRSILKKSSILVLDEATASIDSATDRIVQKIIRREFQDSTVITIAHRIHTVIDSDLVLVLSDGKVVEYDSPALLLERKDSLFSKLIKEYSFRSHNFSGPTESMSA